MVRWLKVLASHTRGPEFDPQALHGGRIEPTPTSCSLTSMFTHVCTHKINKQTNRKKPRTACSVYRKVPRRQGTPVLKRERQGPPSKGCPLTSTCIQWHVQVCASTHEHPLLSVCAPPPPSPPNSLPSEGE